MNIMIEAALKMCIVKYKIKLTKFQFFQVIQNLIHVECYSLYKVSPCN